MSNMFEDSAKLVDMDLGEEMIRVTSEGIERDRDDASDVYSGGIPVSRIKPGTIVKLDSGDTAVIGDDYERDGISKKRIVYVGNTRNSGTKLLLPTTIVHILKHFSIVQ